jgi:hypothetical protein
MAIRSGQLSGFFRPYVTVNVDKETGCSSSDAQALQACRQAYFLKQQNQILKQQKGQAIVPQTAQTKAVNSPATSDFENRFQTMERRIEDINSQQSIAASHQIKNDDELVSLPALPFVLLLIFTIILTATITFYVGRKR